MDSIDLEALEQILVQAFSPPFPGVSAALSMSVDALQAVCRRLLEAETTRVDPTWLLAVADMAELKFGLPEQAAVLYEAGLERLLRHPDEAADDTDCAAASLNLLNLLSAQRKYSDIPRAARRAAQMSFVADSEMVQLAWFIVGFAETEAALALCPSGTPRHRVRVMRELDLFDIAQALFKQGTAADVKAVLAELGVSYMQLVTLGGALNLSPPGRPFG